MNANEQVENPFAQQDFLHDQRTINSDFYRHIDQVAVAAYWGRNKTRDGYIFNLSMALVDSLLSQLLKCSNASSNSGKSRLMYTAYT